MIKVALTSNYFVINITRVFDINIILFHVDLFGQTEPYTRFLRVWYTSCESVSAKTVEAGVYASPWALTFPNLHRQRICAYNLVPICCSF